MNNAGQNYSSVRHFAVETPRGASCNFTCLRPLTCLLPLILSASPYLMTFTVCIN